MREIRDGTIKEVMEKLRLLSNEIEEIITRFDSLDRTGNTLDDFRVRPSLIGPKSRILEI